MIQIQSLFFLGRDIFSSPCFLIRWLVLPKTYKLFIFLLSFFLSSLTNSILFPCWFTFTSPITYPLYHIMYKSPYPTTNTRRRTHLKPSQVAVLQESFVTNALPDATIRTQLAKELAVTERTVQIWFQNRRAKARKSEASLEPNVRTGWIDVPVTKAKPKGSEQPPFQATFRTLVTPECYEESAPIKRRPRSSSKPEKFSAGHSLPPPRAMSEGVNRICHTQEGNHKKKNFFFLLLTKYSRYWTFYPCSHHQSSYWQLGKIF